MKIRQQLPRLFLAFVFFSGLLSAVAVTRSTVLLPAPVFAETQGQQRFLVVHDATDVGGELAWSRLQTAMDLAHLDYDTLDLNQGLTLPPLDDYAAVVTVTEMLWKLPGEQALTLKRYVEDGGCMAVLYRGWHRVLREPFGVYNRRDPEYVTSEGHVVFVGDLFPGVQNLRVDQRHLGEFSSMGLIPLDGADIIAQTFTDGRPLIWSYSFGRGRTIYWNNDWAAIKPFRGFLIQSILAVLPAGGQAVANWATIQVDDFPNAPSIARLEPVLSEYNLRYVDWLYQVWYPDVLSLARKYDIPLSWYIVFNYNNKVSAPFDFIEWENARIEFNDQQVLFGPLIASQVKRSQDEMGFHGYNHISLLAGNWGSLENMIAGLEAANARWQQVGLDEPAHTYVPPNNLYDIEGLQALRTVFPSIRAIAGQNSGTFEEGGDRQFGPDPLDPYFYDLPRWTDGYVWDDTIRWQLISEVGMFGVWTHFIHPDDVINIPLYYPYDPELRNPGGFPWRGDAFGRDDGMYYQFDKALDFAAEHYPWLRYMTTYESYLEMQRYDASRVAFHFLAPDEMAVTFVGEPTHFLLRFNDGRRLDLNNIVGARFVGMQAGDGYLLYVLEGVSDTARLKLLFPEGAS